METVTIRTLESPVSVSLFGLHLLVDEPEGVDVAWQVSQAGDLDVSCLWNRWTWIEYAHCQKDVN